MPALDPPVAGSGEGWLERLGGWVLPWPLAERLRPLPLLALAWSLHPGREGLIVGPLGEKEEEGSLLKVLGGEDLLTVSSPSLSLVKMISSTWLGPEAPEEEEEEEEEQKEEEEAVEAEANSLCVKGKSAGGAQ